MKSGYDRDDLARRVRIMAFESQNTDKYVQEPECKESEEVRKRAKGQREGRHELVLKWRDLPWEVFKVTGIQEMKGQYGMSRILTLEWKGENTKVWACSRMIQEMDDILQRQ